VTNDLISVAGNLTLDGTLTNNTPELEASFLAAYPESAIDVSTGSQVNLIVVAEPGAAVSLLGGLGLLPGLGRRRM
jgi:hypothetical protein